MINTSYKLAPLVTGHALKRRPEPIGQPQAAREESSDGGPRRTLAEVDAAQALLAKHVQRRSGDWPHDLIASASSLRSQRALDAYSLQQDRDDRDYVARVLGVDEYA